MSFPRCARLRNVFPHQRISIRRSPGSAVCTGVSRSADALIPPARDSREKFRRRGIACVPGSMPRSFSDRLSKHPLWRSSLEFPERIGLYARDGRSSAAPAARGAVPPAAQKDSRPGHRRLF